MNRVVVKSCIYAQACRITAMGKMGKFSWGKWANFRMVNLQNRHSSWEIKKKCVRDQNKQSFSIDQTIHFQNVEFKFPKNLPTNSSSKKFASLLDTQ